MMSRNFEEWLSTFTDNIADLIILDKNPLKVDPQELKNIKVLQTIKSGEIIWIIVIIHKFFETFLTQRIKS